MKNSSREKAISKSAWRRLLKKADAVHSKSVIVLMGGVGAEREVSLMSGNAVYNALREELDNIRLVEIGREEPAGLKRLLRGADTVFIALHGTYGEDGTLQGYLDQLGIDYTGSGAEASRRAMQKDVSREVFLANDIPVADGVFLPLDKGAMLKTAGRLGLPVVVKPADSGSSVGVSIVRKSSDLDAAYDKAARETQRGLIVEKFVDGREVTVGILEDEALPIIELRPAREFYDYTAKYTDSGTRYILPAEFDKKTIRAIEKAALDAFRVLGCRGFGRVDIIVGKDGPVVLEVNTIPGFTSHSLVPMAARHVGLDMATLSLLIMALAEKG